MFKIKKEKRRMYKFPHVESKTIRFFCDGSRVKRTKFGAKSPTLSYCLKANSSS